MATNIYDSQTFILLSAPN